MVIDDVERLKNLYSQLQQLQQANLNTNIIENTVKNLKVENRSVYRNSCGRFIRDRYDDLYDDMQIDDRYEDIRYDDKRRTKYRNVIPSPKAIPKYKTGDIFIKSKYDLSYPTKIIIKKVDNGYTVEYQKLNDKYMFECGVMEMSEQMIDEVYKKR